MRGFSRSVSILKAALMLVGEILAETAVFESSKSTILVSGRGIVFIYWEN
jgi:hypothetical protein